MKYNVWTSHFKNALVILSLSKDDSLELAIVRQAHYDILALFWNVMSIIWDITAYDADAFLGKFKQEPFEVEGENITEAIEKAKDEAEKRFRKAYCFNDYSLFNLRKLIDKNAIEYPI